VASTARFRHEDVSAVPKGWRVRTVGHRDHRVRVAFPPGRRQKGSGVLVSILHPSRENPAEACQVKNSNPSELVILGANPPRKRKTNPAELVILGANPSPIGAARVYESFQGQPHKNVIVRDEPHMPAGNYARLGSLVELAIKPLKGGQVMGVTLSPRPLLISNALGKQLYLSGGDQRLDDIEEVFGANSSDRPELGELYSIAYKTAKRQDDFSGAEYEHLFGEGTGERPKVFYDRAKERICFEGGAYTVEAPGIIG
jgi:hypothetical protein